MPVSLDNKKMLQAKGCILITTTTVVLFCCLVSCKPNTPAGLRASKRLHLPFLGLGPKCSGCPPHYCDDDPAIVQGYCCGCAKFYDVLPVGCSPQLQCPLNTYDLCEDYEYMMHCCCE